MGFNVSHKRQTLCAEKEKKGEAQEEMTRQHQGGHERVQDNGRHSTESNCGT